MTATRSTVSCVIFGFLCELPENMLPTFENTMKYCKLVKLQMKEGLNGKDPSHFRNLIQSYVTKSSYYGKKYLYLLCPMIEFEQC